MYEIGLMILGAIIWHVITRFIENIIFAVILSFAFIVMAKVMGFI